MRHACGYSKAVFVSLAGADRRSAEEIIVAAGFSR